MINEKRFAETYNSFWNTILPLSANAIRSLKTISHNISNELDKYEYLPRRRAIINHFAFNLYKYSIKNNIFVLSIKDSPKLVERLVNLTQNQLKSFISKDLPDLKYLRDVEILEAFEMANYMETFFKNHYKWQSRKIVANPKFPGCGFIKNCYGDILINKDLYEIKATKKFFETKDIRQLLTYCALNFNSKKYIIENVGVYNPKMGSYFKININDLCLLFSGNNSIFVFSNIIDFVSSFDMSN